MALGDGLIVNAARDPAGADAREHEGGAGDAFNGGFLFGLLRGRTMRECLRLGNVVGARSTLAPGGLTALPRLDDLP